MELSFVLGLGLLCSHELDAMVAKEWLIFPGLSALPDEQGRAVFVLAHVPLFALIFWGLLGGELAAWRTSLDVFMIGHVVAHLALHGHPLNGFRRPLSWALILGAGVCGAWDLWW